MVGSAQEDRTQSVSLSNKIESVVAKICHAFTAIPTGQGLLTPCNKILQKTLSLVYLQWKPMLYAAITGY
jgi:hypothetical protein